MRKSKQQSVKPMRTMRIHLAPVLLLLVLMFTSACGRRCQAPLTETPTSLTQFEWRMVPRSTTDKDYKPYLTNYNFVTYTFGQFNGFEKVVVNNQAQEEEEAKQNNSFVYVIPRKGLLCIDRDAGPSGILASGNEADLTTRCTAGSNDIERYTYSLSRNGLKLTRSDGAVLDFVPYEGAIAPDNFCTFK